MSKRGPLVDCNVHLWDNASNPVFWLEDRTLVRDLLGDYDSLPDRYTLGDCEQETTEFDVRGIVWSDAGAADPVAAAEWVARQDEGRGLVTGLVSLGDPAAEGFGELLDRLAATPLVTSVRVRLAASPAPDAGTEVPFLDRPGLMDNVGLMVGHGLVATVEATGDQPAAVTQLAGEAPELRMVVDHFGWPTDLSDGGRDTHLERLSELAGRANVATRLDAFGTIFGSWSVAQLRSWLLPVVELFGPDRCMLGSDLPIERLRSSFASLYAAFDEIFAERPADDREELFAGTARRWYGAAT